MAVKKGKSRIIITLPDEQIKWLKSMTKRSKLTLSKYISWLLAKKVEELYYVLKFNENKPTDEELKTIYEIAKIKWIDN